MKIRICKNPNSPQVNEDINQTIVGLMLETTTDRFGNWFNFGRKESLEDYYWVDIKTFITALKEKNHNVYQSFIFKIPSGVDVIIISKEFCEEIC